MFNWLIFQENLENQAVIEVKENQDRKTRRHEQFSKPGMHGQFGITRFQC